jgi:hypothetical protein
MTRNCQNNLRLSKHADMTIHWKALEEHFLSVLIQAFSVEKWLHFQNLKNFRISEVEPVQVWNARKVGDDIIVKNDSHLGQNEHSRQAFQLHVFHTVIRCKEYRMSPN